MGMSRGLLERKVGAEPGSLSQKLAGRRCYFNPLACLLVWECSCVCLCSFLGPEAMLLVGVCICVRACIRVGVPVVRAQPRDSCCPWRCQLWMGGGAARRLARRLRGRGWRALPPRGEKTSAGGPAGLCSSSAGQVRAVRK